MNVAVTLLPTSTAMILFQMSPFFIAIFAFFILGERIHLIEIIGIVICFGGIVMITLSKTEDVDKEQESAADEEDGVHDDYLGVIVGIASAITFALTGIFNRKLKAIDYTALMVYHGLIGGVLALLVILIEGAIKGEFRIYTPH